MLKKLVNIATSGLVSVVVVFAVLLVGVRIVGFTPFTILSPSMTPKYKPGDLVYVKKTDFDKIKVDDTITFTISENVVVTHRVVKIDSEDKLLYTKGDANDSIDTAPVNYKNVIGVVRFSIPKLGYVSNYISTGSGRYVAIAVVCVLALLLVLPEILGKKKKNAETDRADSETE